MNPTPKKNKFNAFGLMHSPMMERLGAIPGNQQTDGDMSLAMFDDPEKAKLAFRELMFSGKSKNFTPDLKVKDALSKYTNNNYTLNVPFLDKTLSSLSPKEKLVLEQEIGKREGGDVYTNLIEPSYNQLPIPIPMKPNYAKRDNTRVVPYQFGGALKPFGDILSSWNSIWGSDDIFASEGWNKNRTQYNDFLSYQTDRRHESSLNPATNNVNTPRNPVPGTYTGARRPTGSTVSTTPEPIPSMVSDSTTSSDTTNPYAMDSLTSNLGGIFSGMNALNSYQPAQKFNMTKGIKGYQQGGTPLDAYGYISSKFPEIQNQMSRDSFTRMTGDQQREFINPYAAQIKQQGDQQLNQRLQQGWEVIDTQRNPVYSEVNQQKQMFEEAFRKAASNKQKIFDFNGKLYTTEQSVNPYAKSTTSKVAKTRKMGPLGELQLGGMINTTGYTPGTSTMNNPYNIIPSNQITMRNTPFPVMGYGDGGEIQLMQPGDDYTFPNSQSVMEIPASMKASPIYSYSQDTNQTTVNPLIPSKEAFKDYRGADMALMAASNFYNAENDKVITDHDKDWDYRKVNGQWQTKRKGAERWISPKGNALAAIEGALDGKKTTSGGGRGFKNSKSTTTLANYITPDDKVTSLKWDPFMESWGANQLPATTSPIPSASTSSSGSTNVPYMSFRDRADVNTPEQNQRLGKAGWEGLKSAGSVALSGKLNPWVMGGAFATSAAESYFNDTNISGGVIGTGAGLYGGAKAAKWVAGKAIGGAKSLITGKTPGTVVNATTGKTFVQRGSELMDETGAVFNKAGVKIKEGSSQAANSVKEFFKRGKTPYQHNFDEATSLTSKASPNNIGIKNIKYKDTRGGLQKIMEDTNVLKSASNVVKSAVQSGKKLSRDAYNKLTASDKKTYDKFFKDIPKVIKVQDKPLASQVFAERAARGPATSFNQFKLGGYVPKYQYGGVVNTADDYNTTIIDPNNTEEYSAIQTEIGETILLPNGNLVRVKADRLHKNMKDNLVTDIVPINSYVFSNDKKMILTKDKMIKGLKLSDIVMGKPIIEYKENDNTKGLQDIKFIDMFKGAKALTPAKISENIKSKFKLEDEFDYFTERSNKENKEQRYDYFQLLTQLSESKKPASKQAPMFRYGGYTVPKASLGELIYYTTPLGIFGELAANRSKKKQEKLNAIEYAKTQGIYDNYMKQAGFADNTAIAGNMATMMAGMNAPLARTSDYNEEISRTNSAYDRANRLLRNNISQPNYSAMNYGSVNPRMDMSSTVVNSINQSNASNAQINNQLSGNILQQNDIINRYITQGQGEYNQALNNRDNTVYNASVQGISGIGQSVTDKYSNFANRTFDKDMNLHQLDLMLKEKASNRGELVRGKFKTVADSAGNLALSAFSSGLLGKQQSSVGTPVALPTTPLNQRSVGSMYSNTAMANPTPSANTTDFWKSWINPINGSVGTQNQYKKPATFIPNYNPNPSYPGQQDFWSNILNLQKRG